MARNRLFLSQETLDRWMELGRAVVTGDVMTLEPSGHRLRLKTGLYFRSEAATGDDAYRLVGVVKDLDQLATMGGEHVAGSVLIGNNAYDVVEGLVAEPLDFDAEP